MHRVFLHRVSQMSTFATVKSTFELREKLFEMVPKHAKSGYSAIMDRESLKWAYTLTSIRLSDLKWQVDMGVVYPLSFWNMAVGMAARCYPAVIYDLERAKREMGLEFLLKAAGENKVSDAAIMCSIMECSAAMQLLLSSSNRATGFGSVEGAQSLEAGFYLAH